MLLEELSCLSQHPPVVPASAVLGKSSLLRSEEPFLLDLGVSKKSALLFASFSSDKEIEFNSFSIDGDLEKKILGWMCSECSCSNDTLVTLAASSPSASGSFTDSLLLLSRNPEVQHVSLKFEYLKLLLGGVSLFLLRILNLTG